MSLQITSRWACRNCRAGLRQQRSSTFTRLFSTTPSTQKAAIPKFTPTSSPELDTLLESIRSKLFVPSYLNKSQLKLVRSTKAKTQLENDPVYATFGEEEIRLTHLNVTKDLPKKKAILDFVDLAKEPKDWTNLPALLEGWHHARPNMRTGFRSKIVKQASKAGQLPIIIQCLWQVEKNGFSMADSNLRHTVIRSIRLDAKRSGWGSATNTSFKQIQTVLELMEKPGHCGSRTVSDTDPRAEPFSIGVALELAARRANNDFGGKDEEGFVALYFKRLITALGQQKSELSTFSIEQIEQMSGQRFDGINDTAKQAALGKFIQLHLPAWNGLKLATEILGKAIPADSRQMAEKYQKDIETKLNLAYEAAHATEHFAKAGRDSFEEWESSRG